MGIVRCAEDLFPSSNTSKRNYGCPPSIAAFADRYRGEPSIETGSAPSNVEGLRLVRARGDHEIASLVKEHIQDALEDGASPSDIAVRSRAGRQRTKICGGVAIEGEKVVRADDPRASESVIADTFLRFKGLERPLVVITGLGLGAKRYEVRMVIALTRTISRGVIIATDEEISKDARLALLS